MERWAWDYVRADTLAAKLAPPPRPTAWESAPPARDVRAGRPAELTPIERPPKTPRPGALVDPAKRAQLVHTFFHHELQAAELMLWALLAFPDAPRPFRLRGGWAGALVAAAFPLAFILLNLFMLLLDADNGLPRVVFFGATSVAVFPQIRKPRFQCFERVLEGEAV